MEGETIGRSGTLWGLGSGYIKWEEQTKSGTNIGKQTG